VTGYQLVFRKLTDIGLLLLTDAKLPSVAGLVAGEPIRGSWWGHPRGQQIFRLSEKLADHPDVTTAKLVANKVTFLHRKLWPALVGVGASREPWQLERLSRAARSFLERVEREGSVRTDRVEGVRGGRRKVGEMSRELEKRLLVHSEQVHTESGAHAKSLEGWARWAERVALDVEKLDVKESKRRIEDAVRTLAAPRGVHPRLPWGATDG
jgi:hypothetical protein